MLYCRVIDGVAAYVAAEAQRFTARVEQVLRIDHPILVDVLPAELVLAPDGEHCLGTYYWTSAGDPSIVLAGDLRSVVTDRGKRGALAIFRDTYAHELAHYEQWRDGRPVQERGVAVRARTIQRLVAAMR